MLGGQANVSMSAFSWRRHTHSKRETMRSCARTRRPVLIGTTSVQQSEVVLRALQRGTSRQAFAQQQDAIQVLNAKPEKVSAAAAFRATAPLHGARPPADCRFCSCSIWNLALQLS